MQHGTAREYVEDKVENVLSALVRERDAGRPYGDLILALRKALGALDRQAAWDIDEPGIFGPDYALWPVLAAAASRPQPPKANVTADTGVSIRDQRGLGK
jgi:hypothetical protein